MAAMIGLGEFSISVSTSCRPGGFGGLPNSVMSAPAIKVRPPQVRTIAFTSGSAMARLMQSKMPPRTAALNAFTGGLSTVTMAMTSRRSSLTTSFTGISLGFLFLTSFALRNLIPHLDSEGYFEARPLSTRSAQQQAMKRPAKKVATDRSFVVALSRGLDVLRAFRPNDGLLGNQEIAARTNLPKPTVSRLTYTLTKLGYLTPVPRFEKYQLAPSAMALGYAALANLGVRHLSEPFREEVMRETGGAVAVGGRDRTSMIYFGQSRGQTVGVQLDVGSRVPIATTAMGRAYIWALPDEERASLLRELREHYGSRWPRMREGIERAGETVAKLGFAISAGEWHDDIHAVGVALKLNDGTGPYAFNCGAPAFRFTEDRLRNDIGPRLVAMVRNIEAALGGAAPALKAGGSRAALKTGGVSAAYKAGGARAAYKNGGARAPIKKRNRQE